MTNLTSDQQEEVSQHIFVGRKIDAIKSYREYSGVDLKQAKESVEAMEQDLRDERLGEFVEDKAGMGARLTLMLIFLIAIGTMIWSLIVLFG